MNGDHFELTLATLRVDLEAAGIDESVDPRGALCAAMMFGTGLLSERHDVVYIMAIAAALKHRWSIPLTVSFDSPLVRDALAWAKKRMGYEYPVPIRTKEKP